MEKNMNIKNVLAFFGAFAIGGCAATTQPQRQEHEVSPQKQMSFTIDVFKLEAPIHIVARSVRIPVAGTPECFQAIRGLYSSFFKDGTPDKIKNKKERVIHANKGHFGLCHDHAAQDDKVAFTYTLGIQVTEPPDDRDLPADTHRFAIAPGEYARIRVSAPSNEAEGIAWAELNKWRENSTEWRGLGGEYEVYIDDDAGWREFELWQPVGRK